MDIIKVSDLDTPVDLGEYFNDVPLKGRKPPASVEELIKKIKAQYDPDVVWCFSSETYDSLKRFHLFPDPTRKLRKVQLRRLYARKRTYRQHQARVNAAIKARLGVVS